MLALLFGLFALQAPPPWGGLWVLVPAATAASVLAGWRFGPRSVLVPIGLFGATIAIAGPFAVWSWWVPMASLSGVWMGLREEGGGPESGERLWMLLPLLLLAACVPWAVQYPAQVARFDRDLRQSDKTMLDFMGSMNVPATQLRDLRTTFAEQADIRSRVLPHVVPTLLFGWMVWLVGSGRLLAARAAASLKWPPLSRGRRLSLRLPDGALWLLIAGLALLVVRWPAWAPTAWTLLLNGALGFGVQGIAVVESLLLARGVPPSIIVLTMLFVFALATPVFVLTALAVGLSDVWLDYRRLEAVPERDEPS